MCSEQVNEEPLFVWDFQISAEAEVIKADGTVKEDED